MNVKKWVEALRSGEYEQGKGALCKDGKYCCLGVACEVYQKEVGDLVVEDGRYNGSGLFLPYDVMFWLGLKSYDGKFAGGTLAGRNDNGVPFHEIADIIEERYAELFH